MALCQHVAHNSTGAWSGYDRVCTYAVINNVPNDSDCQMPSSERCILISEMSKCEMCTRILEIMGFNKQVGLLPWCARRPAYRCSESAVAASPPPFCFPTLRTSVKTTSWRGVAGRPVNHEGRASRRPGGRPPLERLGWGTGNPPRQRLATPGGKASRPGQPQEPPAQVGQAPLGGRPAQKPQR